MQGKGRESGTAGPRTKAVTDAAVIFGAARRLYLAKARAEPRIRVAIRGHPRSLRARQRHAAGLEKMRADAEPKHLEALLQFAARAYRRPLSKAERDDHAGLLPQAAEKNGLTHEDADARFDRQHPDVARFPVPRSICWT